MAKEFSRIEEALRQMKTGEEKQVRLSPGREGVMYLKKKEKAPVEDLVDTSTKRRAKLIMGKGVRAVAPASYD